jgi:hypothetical protein
MSHSKLLEERIFMDANLRLASVALITILLTLVGAGCGTAHHFLPAQPLERNEWQISLVWHYDFNQRITGLTMPNLNAYIGAGADWNLGLGAQAPCFVSHLTFAKYMETGSNDYWAVFAHANQFFGLSNNPYLELGGQYSAFHKSYFQSVAAGLAYGHGLAVPGGLFTLANVGDQRGGGSRNHILPFIKLGVAGRDFGMSYSHYHGQTRASVAGTRERLLTQNDTLYYFKPSEVDSMKSLDGHRFARYHEFIWGMFLPNGDTLILLGPGNGGDVFPALLIMAIHTEYDRFWSRQGFTRVRVFLCGHGRQWWNKNDEAIVELAELKKAVDTGNEVIITEYSPAAIRFVQSIRSYQLDHSIGIGVQFRSDKYDHK